ncbi:MAG: MFS transporter [Acidimicrobiia bacterium]|nr:MFS transporter [Acidimicrobiia bacterium]
MTQTGTATDSAAGAAGPGSGRLLTWRFLAVTVAGLAYFVGWTILYPVLPRFVEDELGGTGAEVGLAVGSFGITAALLRPVAGRMGDRYGRRVLVVGGMLVVAVALLGYLVADSILMVIGLRLLFGVGEAFAFVGLATAAQDMASDDRRGEAANYFSFAVYGGVAAGPPLGEWLFRGGSYDRVWIVASAFVLGGALLGLVTPVGATGRGRSQPGLIHREALLPGLALTGGLFGYAGFVSFVAVYARSIGLANAGLVFTLYAVLIMVARVVGAKVPDRYGALRIGSLSLVALGAGLLLVAAVATPVGLFAGVVVFASGMAMNFPALLAVVVNRSAASERAFAVASLSVFFDVAFAVGAVVMGLIVGAAGERVAFAVGGLCALAGLVPLRLYARRPAPTSLPVPGVGPTSAPATGSDPTHVT